MIVSKENCTGCPAFDTVDYQDNMIKNDICGRRYMVGCYKEEVK